MVETIFCTCGFLHRVGFKSDPMDIKPIFINHFNGLYFKYLISAQGNIVSVSKVPQDLKSCGTYPAKLTLRNFSYKNAGGLRISIFASLNTDEVLRMLNKKLLFPPIGVQKNESAQQCMLRFNEK